MVLVAVVVLGSFTVTLHSIIDQPSKYGKIDLHDTVAVVVVAGIR